MQKEEITLAYLREHFSYEEIRNLYFDFCVDIRLRAMFPQMVSWKYVKEVDTSRKVFSRYHDVEVFLKDKKRIIRVDTEQDILEKNFFVPKDRKTITFEEHVKEILTEVTKLIKTAELNGRTFVAYDITRLSDDEISELEKGMTALGYTASVGETKLNIIVHTDDNQI